METYCIALLPMIIQILITIVALTALGAVARAFARGALSRVGLMVWLVLWVGVGVLVWVPEVTNRIAALLGVGRGADAIFYVSIVLLFYMMFRLYGKIENLEHQLSDLVKKIALKDVDHN